MYVGEGGGGYIRGILYKYISHGVLTVRAAKMVTVVVILLILSFKSRTRQTE